MKKSQLDHRPFVNPSGCSYLGYPDKAIITWINLDNSCQGPMAGECLILLQDDDIIHLKVGLLSLPLGPGLQSVQIFLRPPGPEMLDCGLALVPFPEEIGSAGYADGALNSRKWLAVRVINPSWP